MINLKLPDTATILKWGLFALLALFLFFWLRSCSRNKDLETELKASKQSVKYWQDESGNAHARLKKVEYEKKEMKKQVDSIAAVLKIKPKTIKSYIQADAKIDTVLKPEYIPVYITDTIQIGDSIRIDSILAYQLDYQDSVWLSIKGTVPSKSGLQVSLQTKISVTEFYKKKWFLGKKHHYIDIGVDNPYIKLSNAQSYHLKPPARLRIRPGIGLGVTYDPINQRFVPGIQGGIYIFRSR